VPRKPPSTTSGTKGGARWVDVTVQDIKAWLGIVLYMGVKKLPAIRHYWALGKEVLLCTIIHQITSCKRWESITRCIHLVYNSTLLRATRVVPQGRNDSSSDSEGDHEVFDRGGSDTVDSGKSHWSDDESVYREDVDNFADDIVDLAADYVPSTAVLIDESKGSPLGGQPETYSDSLGSQSSRSQGETEQCRHGGRLLLLVDPYAKTRWLLDHFVAFLQAIYNCECELTVDELIIPYKGLYSVISQYLRGKPIRFGIKVFCLASSKSRFVYNIKVFLEKGIGGGPGGLAMQVVLRLTNCLQGLWHTVVTENFFTSVRLCHELLCRGFWSTGTV
jgi:hypothetical protein